MVHKPQKRTRLHFFAIRLLLMVANLACCITADQVASTANGCRDQNAATMPFRVLFQGLQHTVQISIT